MPTDDLEPVGYDGFGAPLYEHQLPPRANFSPLAYVQSLIARMTLWSPSLPEAFRRKPKPNLDGRIWVAPTAEVTGWKDVGYTSEDGFLDPNIDVQVVWGEVASRPFPKVDLTEYIEKTNRDIAEIARLWLTPWEKAFREAYGLDPKPICRQEIPAKGTE